MTEGTVRGSCHILRLAGAHGRKRGEGFPVHLAGHVGGEAAPRGGAGGGLLDCSPASGPVRQLGNGPRVSAQPPPRRRAPLQTGCVGNRPCGARAPGLRDRIITEKLQAITADACHSGWSDIWLTRGSFLNSPDASSRRNFRETAVYSCAGVASVPSHSVLRKFAHCSSRMLGPRERVEHLGGASARRAAECRHSCVTAPPHRR